MGSLIEPRGHSRARHQHSATEGVFQRARCFPETLVQAGSGEHRELALKAAAGRQTGPAVTDEG